MLSDVTSPPLTISSFLTRRAIEIPHAVALLAPDRESLTYGALLTQCHEVATFLRTQGLGRTDRIALVLPNGPEMALAFLSFAGYVTTAPLNPGYTATEFDFYLEDLQASALVVQAGINSPAITIAKQRQIPILMLTPLLDDAAGRFTLSGTLDLSPTDGEPAQPDDIALVLHTSGTTSRPKIVPLTQANLCHSAHHIAQSLALTPQDRCLNVMPLFHIHGLIAAVLSSLASGGSVVCTPGFLAPQFFPWLEQFSPTWYTAVPTMHQAILERAQGQPEHTLRFIRSASSALPPQVMAALEAVFQVPALEAYGMTEGSHQLASNPLPPAARKPGSVGLAAGPEVAVMDAQGTLLPPEAVGELVIRGANVTPGYENHPEANASAFIHGWFRTGDQGYIDSEGYIFLTGRLKEIINRGGEKIAPREIEEALLDHPDVAQAVVFALPHARLGETVGAAVILRPGRDVTPDALRVFLADSLADFKLPEKLLFLTEFPKGATGKLQRIGMAERLGIEPIKDQAPTERPPYRAPQTPDETQLVALWEQVLGQQQIGVEDPFFFLGGDSMLATQLLSRIRNTFGVEIRFVEFFISPTIAGLVQQIEVKRNQITNAPSLCPVVRDSALPLSFAQERLWFLNQLDPENRAYNRTYALRLEGPLDVSVLERVLHALVERHEALRTVIPLVEGTPHQIILPPTSPPLEVLETLEEEVEERATAFAQTPYVLTTGPVWRAQLLRIDAQKHLLLIGIHHIASDGWSRAVLFDEILQLYPAFQTGEPSPLNPLPLQYADFALWQRQWLQGSVREEQLQYWVQQLAELTPLTLQTDRPRPPIQTDHGATSCHTLAPGLTQQLKELGRQENTTLFMTVLAAFNVLLSRYSGQEDIALGAPIANRNRAEIEGLIGFFANTLVLRTNLSGAPSFRSLLGRVRTRTLEAYTYQDLPFETLVEVLQPERDQSRNPLFQVMLVQHNPPLEETLSGGITFREQELTTNTATFDLTLIFRETPLGLEFQWEYNTDLFDSSTIARMQSHWETLLEALVDKPETPITQIEILTKEEKHQLLVEWNDTKADYPNVCL